MQGRAHTHARAHHRVEQRQAQGGDARRGPPPQDVQRGGLRLPARVGGHDPVDGVGRHDHEAGQDRSEGRPGEAPLGLEHPGEDHTDPIQGHLEGEHAQEVGHEARLKRRIHTR